MFSIVLFPTDFSDVSLKARNYVKKLKEAGTEKVILLTVIDNYTLDDALEICEYKNPDNFEECIKNLEESTIEKHKEKLARIGDDIGIPYEVVVKTGKPFKEIIETAKEYDAKLIVMGSHGRGEIEELLIGSVTENVIRHTNLPVLVVR